MPFEFTVLSNHPPEVKYTVDLNRVNAGKSEIRETIDGPENTMVMLIPPKGCRYHCDFCSIKNIANPNFPVSTEEGGVDAAKKVAMEIDALLHENQEVETLKLFNAGNILYGTERKGSGELNEAFWAALVDVMGKYKNFAALEIEVRIDEFIGPGITKNGQLTPKGVLRERLAWLNTQMKGIDKKLRCILALEYIESKIISQQSKFPQAFTTEDRGGARCEQAIDFMREHEIEWLSYAMLGGRLKDRALNPEEATASAAHTALFGLEHGAREAIINSQYLDPINFWEQKRDGVNYFVPAEKNMVDTLRLIVSGLGKIPAINGHVPRVRLTTDKEDVIEGAIGPDVSPAFRQLMLQFNNASDQLDFFGKKMDRMTFDSQGKWDDGDITPVGVT